MQHWKNLTNGYVFLHVPSPAVGPELLKQFTGSHLYEERALFLIFTLNNPSNHLHFFTSHRVHPCIIKYYTGLLTNEGKNDAIERLHLWSCDNTDSLPLAQKMLNQGNWLKRVQRVLSRHQYETIFSSFIHTELEDQLCEALEIKLQRKAQDYQKWGTKMHSRIIFRDIDCPHALGTYNIAQNLSQLAYDILQLKLDNIETVMLKLNEGVSGIGNVIFNIPDGNLDIIEQKLEEQLRAASGNGIDFLQLLHHQGIIVEEYLHNDSAVITCPSVQGFIENELSYYIISTHEQIMNGVTYSGCKFPCKENYRSQITEYGLNIARLLAENGAIGSFGVDFIALESDDGKIDLQALEINLRQLGTTHPMMTMDLLVRGNLDDSGAYVDENGQARYYTATDHLKITNGKCFTVKYFTDLISKTKELQFDQENKTGVVFHMLSFLPIHGEIGVTCIGKTEAEVDDIYNIVESILTIEADRLT